MVPVTVCIRIRPLLSSSTTTGDDSNCVTCTSRDQLQLINDKVFRFDRVFPPTSDQSTIYNEVIHPLVLSCTQGINCTVFAYGQTGSGKTYTLGSEGTSLYRGGPNEGIISRTLTDIFNYVKKEKEEVKCSLSVSYVEVYKEEMRDLLATEDCDGAINIREDEQGHTVMVGVVEEEVSVVEEALNLLETGNAIRVTMATEMNTHSSRSHVVFTLTLIQEKMIQLPVPPSEEEVGRVDTPFCTKLISKFHFVDLAGSERVNRTHNTGERFKESVHINGGLLALGNVITALSDSKRKSSHVPYRDSKITRLLKDSLGGHAHTVMITCLSPCERDLPETLNTLKYAKRARNIKNHPIINQDPHAASVLAMRDEIENLRAKLSTVQLQEETPTNNNRSDVKVDKEIIAEKEREMANLLQQFDLVKKENEHLTFVIDQMKDKERELLDKIELLENQLEVTQKFTQEVTQEVTEEVIEDQSEMTKGHMTVVKGSHDLEWSDIAYQVIHDKINLTCLKDLSHESCDLALHQMTSLLAACRGDVIKRSHDQIDDVIERSHDQASEVNDEMTELRENLIMSQDKLKEMEKWFAHEQHKIQSLTLKIKFKEELIHELIKNNKAVQSLNSAYQRKISSLENEAASLKKKIEKTTIHSQTTNHGNDDKEQLLVRLKQTQVKLKTLQKRRQETLRLLEAKGGGGKSEGRIQELEGELDRLRNKQALLVKKVKIEGERKRKLEKEIEQCQKNVTKLKLFTEQQGHVLKVKTEEVAIAQRKLRDIKKRPVTVQHTPLGGGTSSVKGGKWLEEQVKKLRDEKRSLDKLQKDLRDREQLLIHHEQLLKEKTSLQLKRQQTQRNSSQSVLHLSVQLNTLDDLIRKKKQTLRDSLDDQCQVDDDVQIEIRKLKEKHQSISERKQILEGQLSNEKILSHDEETRILELQEQIEVLENSLQLKMTSLYQRVLPPQSQELISLQSKVTQLSKDEAHSLLTQSLLRILKLEEELGEKEKECEGLVNKFEHEKGNVEMLRQSLTQLHLDKQWKLDKSKKEHAREMHQLISHMTHQVAEDSSTDHIPTPITDDASTVPRANSVPTSDHSGPTISTNGTTGASTAEEEVSVMRSKIKSLERDLYFYKKTSRDLKQQLGNK